jgi:hypothetical protein
MEPFVIRCAWASNEGPCILPHAHIGPHQWEKKTDLAQSKECKEAVDHPSHYGGDTTYEHIKVVNAWGLNYELGNATKYICRAGKKNPETAIEDLEKAVWYLQAEIKRLREKA